MWVIGRTQTNGTADYEFVHKIQDGLRITSLNPVPEHAIDPDLDTDSKPLELTNRMSAVEFFTHAAGVMKVNPPHATDFDQLARIAALGIVPGQDFDATAFDAAQLAEIEAGAAEGRDTILAAPPRQAPAVNGWMTLAETMGVYGNSYLRRAAVTLVGLGANPAADAVYPLLVADSDGDPLDGGNDYVLHLDADKMPPPTPSGPSPCTTPKASTPPTNSTATPSATETP